jgi:hypothetical protein
MREPEVQFDAPPTIGTVLSIDGLTFHLLRVEPYIRQTDGLPTQLLVWRGACATCGQSFEAMTGLRSKAVNKRCQAHKAMGKPATPAARARYDASRRPRRRSRGAGR